MPVSLHIGGTALVAFGLLYYVFGSRAQKKTPPGPKPRFLIGNASDIPMERTWETFTEWKEIYGDVVYLEAMGKSIIILNSHEACIDLLEQRSVIYSDRPRFVMLQELMNWGWSLVIQRYGPRWRTNRRLFRKFFDEGASRQYMPAQEKDIHAFLRMMLKEPHKYWDNARLIITESILDITYNIRGNKNIVKLVEDALQSANGAVIPGQFLVDVFPLLKYVPSWVPGAGFQKKAAEWRQLVSALRDLPAEIVKENIRNGTAAPSIFATMISEIEDGSLIPDEALTEPAEEIAKSVAAVIYGAGADTMLITTRAFLLAMSNHPEIQRQAQAEIDNVVGTSRLPNANDMSDLPYIQAIVKETLRWHNPVPLGVAHASTEEDEYRGYHIPKGAIIMPNIWAILHDPQVYHDPYTFNPSRWLIKTDKGWELNDNMPGIEAVFGFGRRMCPGRFFAQNALFLLVSNILASFNISPLDKQGKPVDRIDPTIDTTGFLSFIEQFDLSIVPRSSRAEQNIADTE